MAPPRDALLIDVRVLLDYDLVSVDTYRSVGVDPKDVQLEPYYSWLGAAMSVDLEVATELQVARDGRLAQRLFDHQSKVRELWALDIAHLFVEAGAQVIVVSHETPDALDALVARAGLPASVEKIGLNSPSQRVKALAHVFEKGTVDWCAVYQIGLTPKQERSIVDALRGHGIFVNIKAHRSSGSIDDQLLEIICERWQK